MRRFVAIVAALTIAVGGAGVMPAQATHNCTSPDCNPIVVAVLEGLGYVCNQADIPKQTGEKCTYPGDAISDPGGEDTAQGLYWPGVGPGAKGPFSFTAGTATSPPGSACAATVGGPGCKFESYGDLLPGNPTNVGAYCGSSKGVGVSTFTSGRVGGASLITKATFGWEQSFATILPLQGTVTSSTPAGGKGATVVGFTSSRGFSGGGNCGVTSATTQFQVEGMVVTF